MLLKVNRMVIAGDLTDAFYMYNHTRRLGAITVCLVKERHCESLLSLKLLHKLSAEPIQARVRLFCTANRYIYNIYSS